MISRISACYNEVDQGIQWTLLTLFVLSQWIKLIIIRQLKISKGMNASTPKRKQYHKYHDLGHATSLTVSTAPKVNSHGSGRQHTTEAALHIYKPPTLKECYPVTNLSPEELEQGLTQGITVASARIECKGFSIPPWFCPYWEAWQVFSSKPTVLHLSQACSSERAQSPLEAKHNKMGCCSNISMHQLHQI